MSEKAMSAEEREATRRCLEELIALVVAPNLQTLAPADVKARSREDDIPSPLLAAIAAWKRRLSLM